MLLRQQLRLLQTSHWTSTGRVMGSESTSQLVLSVGGSHCVSRPVSVDTTSYQMMGSSSVESTGSPSIPTLRSFRRKPPSPSSIVPMMTHQSHLSLPNVHKSQCPTNSKSFQKHPLLCAKRGLSGLTISLVMQHLQAALQYQSMPFAHTTYQRNQTSLIYTSNGGTWGGKGCPV